MPAARRATRRYSLDKLNQLDPFRAALAFIDGDVEVEGDLVAALQSWLAERRRGPRAWDWLLAVAARARIDRWLQTRARARRDIEFHYDRSNEFYTTFLDRRLVYSCAYFEEPAQSLDAAQAAKLDLVCRKLDLNPGERFLDVGCGWGALVSWAAERYGVEAFGCTLSREQHGACIRLLGERGLAGRARVDLLDYRDVSGRFNKIASIGMVEHVGRSRLPGYFRTLASRLQDDGLLLNHGINRPLGAHEDAATVLLQRRVFPGGELCPLEETLVAAERAGFEVLDVENLRPHYALTCRAWVSRLQQQRAACVRLVGANTYRTWLLYLAASAAGFEAGTTDVYQVLLAKRTPAQKRRLSRQSMYAPRPPSVLV
jgi:cyclopropane-fatty-acyl-phospholipid synthase